MIMVTTNSSNNDNGNADNKVSYINNHYNCYNNNNVNNNNCNNDNDIRLIPSYQDKHHQYNNVRHVYKKSDVKGKSQ